VHVRGGGGGGFALLSMGDDDIITVYILMNWMDGWMDGWMDDDSYCFLIHLFILFILFNYFC